jgi:signal transduction histidine kinase
MVDAAQCSAIQAELRRRSTGLLSRWTAEARAVVALGEPDAIRSDVPLVGMPAPPELLDALLAALTREGPPGEIVTQGLRYGSAAFAAGMSLHHAVKLIGLLTSVVLDAIGEILQEAGAPRATASEALGFARALHRSSALLTLATMRGHTQSDAEALRERFRHLRHDMRNPLGTIKSVLALMDDESVPIESRANPNFRAIASRNARSLEEMISLQLGDAAIASPRAAQQDISLGALLGAVQRDVRPEAERRGVIIDIDRADVRVPLDVPGLELLLYAVIVAFLAESTPGERIVIEVVRERTDGLSLRLRRASGCAPIADAFAAEGLVSLARRMGSALTVDDALVITLPALDRRQTEAFVEREPHVRSRRGDGSGGGQSRDDVGGARQGEHGETGGF